MNDPDTRAARDVIAELIRRFHAQPEPRRDFGAEAKEIGHG